MAEKTYFADSADAHVVRSDIAGRSIFSGVKGMYLRVVLVSAVELTWIVDVKERQPRVLLPFDDFAVLLRALLRAEAWLVFRTRIDVAGFVAGAFADAEGSTISWGGVVALAGLH